MRGKSGLTAYLFLAPAMILLLAFGILPILVAGVVSLTDMDIAGLGNWANIQFIGLQNYTDLIGDSSFWQALRNTSFFVVIGVPAIVLISLVVALMLNAYESRFLRPLRSFYFVPAITGIVAISLVWG